MRALLDRLKRPVGATDSALVTSAVSSPVGPPVIVKLSATLLLASLISRMSFDPGAPPMITGPWIAERFLPAGVRRATVFPALRPIERLVPGAVPLMS